MNKKTKLLLVLFLPVQLIGLSILKHFPEFVERYYSNGVYPFFSKTARFLFGWIPFSVGDIFYLLLGIIALRWIYKNFYRLRSNPLGFFVDIIAAFSIIYFMFNVLWGFNYYRMPLYKSLALERQYTTPELIDMTERFIEKSNQMHRKLGYADSVKIDLPFSQNEIMKRSVNGYKNLEKSHPNLSYEIPSLKKSTWSLLLTYMGYSGYYNPFSGEAQVNRLIKNYKFSVVSTHEQAHQIGFAAENEANFIATLATLHNDDNYIRYSGYIFALRYLINEVARRDRQKYDQLLTTINPGILKSYKEMRDFWESYQNPFETLSKAFWDTFLNANNQSRGIMSYSYMVALVVNYYKDKPL